MRILIGGMNHESNTLNPIITGEEDFVVFYGDEMMNRGMLPYYSSTGIINTLKNAGCEIIPTVLARAVPNGVVSESFYKKIKGEFMKRTREAMAAAPIDGICLALHGSMKVEGIGCAEGDLLMALRELLPGIPLTVALDMHATITPEMLKCADGFVGYKTAPHVDCQETGAHAAAMLLKSLRTGKKLASAYRRVPMLIAGEKSESEAEPMNSLIEMCRQAEKAGGVEAASFLLGFPWADNEHNAVCALVTSLEDREPAERAAGELAAAFWKKREDFKFRSEFYDSATSIKKALEAVLEKKEEPVFVSDSGDNPTAGAAGDATDMLEQVMAHMDTIDTLPTPLLYSGFFDKPAVEACIKAGEGASIAITAGGNWDTLNGKKIPMKVEVKKIVRGYSTYKSDLVLVKYRNMLLSLTSKHIGFGDPDLLPALGVDAKDYCLVVVKLGYLEPCFRTIAKRAIMATSKGCSNEVLETIPYKRVKRPLYPLDRDMQPAF